MDYIRHTNKIINGRNRVLYKKKNSRSSALYLKKNGKMVLYSWLIKQNKKVRGGNASALNETIDGKHLGTMVDEYLDKILEDFTVLKSILFHSRETQEWDEKNINTDNIGCIVRKTIKRTYENTDTEFGPYLDMFILDIKLISNVYDEAATHNDISRKLQKFIQKYDNEIRYNRKKTPLNIFYGKTGNSKEYIWVQKHYVGYIRLIGTTLHVYYSNYAENFKPDRLEVKNDKWMDISENRIQKLIALTSDHQSKSPSKSSPKSASQTSFGSITRDNRKELVKKYYNTQEVYDEIFDIMKKYNSF